MRCGGGATDSPRSGGISKNTCVSHETRVQRPLLPPNLRGAASRGGSGLPQTVDPMPEPGDLITAFSPSRVAAFGWSTAIKSKRLTAPERQLREAPGGTAPGTAGTSRRAASTSPRVTNEASEGF
jgi:hypothetical protein